MSNLAKTIFTHMRPDLDACASVWAVRTYVPDAKQLSIRFVPANWNGRGRERRPNDFLLDLSAGTKGELIDGRRHSCFALLMKQYAPLEDQVALRSLIDFVDATDSTGSAYLALAPQLTQEQARLFASTGLSAVISALAVAPDASDEYVVSAMCLILDGMRQRALAFQRKLEMAKDPNVVKRFTTNAGETVCLVIGAQGMGGVLFSEGPHIRFVIYTSPSGLEYGVNRSDLVPDLDIHNPQVQQILAEAGEKDGWFVHPNGFLLAWGTSKAPAKRQSRVQATDLAQAYIAYLESLRPAV